MGRGCFYALGLMVFLSLSGCGGALVHPPESLVSDNWGRSVASMMHRQMAAPDPLIFPDRPSPPVTGLDPQAAEEVTRKYRQSFEHPIELPGYTVVPLGGGG
jgi:hypothetical protein